MQRLSGLISIVAATLLAPGAALAAAGGEACGPRLIVDFAEGSADLFVLRNASAPGWSVQRVELDLRDSAGSLIFDVTEAGAGVSAYQPYAAVGGTAAVVGRSEVTDGDSLLSLAFDRFAPEESFRFSIDLDDTLAGHTQTWIDGTEIQGGVVRAVFVGADGAEAERSATFEPDSRADTGRGENCLISRAYRAGATRPGRPS